MSDVVDGLKAQLASAEAAADVKDSSCKADMSDLNAGLSGAEADAWKFA